MRGRTTNAMDEEFSLRRWKFEHWFSTTCSGEPAQDLMRAPDGTYADPRVAVAWQAWQKAIESVTDIPQEWELSVAAGSQLAYEFKWLFGIHTAAELARRLAHEPRLFEMAIRRGYLHLKEPTATGSDVAIPGFKVGQ